MQCNFERLVFYLRHELSEDRKFEVVAHLHECEICMEAVTLMSQELSAEDEDQDGSIIGAIRPETASVPTGHGRRAIGIHAR